MTIEQGPRGPRMNRRSLLGLGAGVAGTALLAACGSGGTKTSAATSPTVPSAGGGGTSPTASASTRATTGPTSSPGGAALQLPTSAQPKPVAGMVTSDVPGVAPAYKTLAYPGYQTVAKTPGSGGTVTSFSFMYGAPPTPESSNGWWQGMNKALGVDLKSTVIDAQDFGTKLVTMIASGSIADITTNEPSYRGLAGRKYLTQGVFYDLREFLGGDQVKQYPNLALVPEFAWKNSRINGAVYGVPCYRNQTIGGTICFRQDWAAKGGHPSKPTDADDLFAWLQAMKKGGSGQSWPLATIDQTLGFCGGQVYKVPNDWKLNSDGTLTKDFETPEFKEALAFAIKIHHAGLCHPDIVTLTPNPSQYQSYFYAGRVGVCNGAINGYFGTTGMFAQLKTQSGSSAEGDVLIPPGATGGIGMVPPDLGFYGMLSIPTQVKSSDKIAELLRIIDYWAAPMGAKEWYLDHYGVAGHNYTVQNGNIVPTTNAKISAESTFLGFDTSFSQGFYFPGAPDDAITCQKYAEQMVKGFVADPTAGLYSPTSISNGDNMGQIVQEYEQDMVTERKPIGALNEMISRWKAAGGDQVRKEYEQAIAAAKSAAGK